MKLPRSRMSLRDLGAEAAAGVMQRPARSALTAVGTVLGVGALIAVTGLTSTAASQIDARFNQLTATEVTVDDIGPSLPGQPGPAFPADADARVERLHGVTAAGVSWHVRLQPGQVIASGPPGAAYAVTDRQAQLTAVSAGALRAVGPTLQQGRVYDKFHEEHRQRVAVLGSATASRLGITNLQGQPAVFIGSTSFVVIGILADVQRRPDLLTSVIIPRASAQDLWGAPVDDPAKMLITTQLGAAAQIASEVPLALRPDHPDYLRAIPPPDPRNLRSGVENDLGQLFLLLAAICLVIGAVGIANTTLVAVLERSGEIGLRRALGARARHITAQFLAESMALGLLGGVVGASLGTVTIVAVATVKQWTPVLHPATIATAPLLGLVTGLLAGAYPAWRASRIQPAEALRR
ncbi:ABC transporter permease [Kitasatospora purpeofusca]|uniref:ABC transporter permease n=1 Tax=Kitasatospora purpeofusca TaxID=67352 RepID=UPI00224DBE28|nr:ABC transporter permease [Kitasatospora purpeofusca]MCX4754310.1 ABC transporter permease [Kitasatospora purpeofusca]WSR33738.1 ABC transporter permease [Kitasatospora purpeofusca]